jgi:hypothetical protein
MNVRNWKKVAQNRDSWKKVDEQARTIYRLQRFIRREEETKVRVLNARAGGTSNNHRALVVKRSREWSGI